MRLVGSTRILSRERVDDLVEDANDHVRVDRQHDHLRSFHRLEIGFRRARPDRLRRGRGVLRVGG
jgi:hypothetical protein